jgi:hypothetical protein
MDDILLYREGEMISSSDININSLSIKNKPFFPYSIFNIADEYNFSNNDFDIPFSVTVINELGLVPNMEQSSFTVQESGVYRIDMSISSTIESDATYKFYLYVNSSPVAKAENNNLCKSITAPLFEGDVIRVYADDRIGTSMINFGSYLFFNQIR